MNIIRDALGGVNGLVPFGHCISPELILFEVVV